MVAVEEKKRAQSWLDTNIDDAAKAEIRRMMDSDNPEELVDSFYKNLEFGTGGLRGIMGIGSNRVNKYTIGMATQGLANYLKKSFPNEEIKVAIAYDSRNNSQYFGGITARTGNDSSTSCFKARIFDSVLQYMNSCKLNAWKDKQEKYRRD